MCEEGGTYFLFYPHVLTNKTLQAYRCPVAISMANVCIISILEFNQFRPLQLEHMLLPWSRITFISYVNPLYERSIRKSFDARTITSSVGDSLNTALLTSLRQGSIFIYPPYPRHLFFHSHHATYSVIQFQVVLKNCIELINSCIVKRGNIYMHRIDVLTPKSPDRDTSLVVVWNHRYFINCFF